MELNAYWTRENEVCLFKSTMTLNISDLFQSPSFRLMYNAQLQLKTTQKNNFFTRKLKTLIIIFLKLQ